jgi:hypothetical protein
MLLRNQILLVCFDFDLTLPIEVVEKYKAYRELFPPFHIAQNMTLAPPNRFIVIPDMRDPSTVEGIHLNQFILKYRLRIVWKYCVDHLENTKIFSLVHLAL